MEKTMTLGFGVTSTIDLELAQRIAPSIEDAGFTFFWSNDIPGGSSFDVLAAVAGVTDSISLANGVVPIDRVPADTWRDSIERAGLMGNRFWPGIGSGRLERPLVPVSDAIRSIRQLTGRPVVIGALRSRMRRLAAEEADGVLLNWLTPQAAAERREEMNGIRRDSGLAGSFMTAAFVRVAIGDAAIDRLRAEADRYESFPAYGKHFAEMGVGAFATAVAAASVEEAAAMLAPFLASIDHAVLRCVVANEDDQAYLELVETGRLAIEGAASV
jgi:alkanesulfonate monooxygenase SsuD/methylene tetrahydromethanopterin reductase-like flavin-dependent oxidoreductase (luciferase family)